MVLVEIIMYNLAWFITIAIVGVISGIVYAWKPPIFMLCAVVFGVYFVVSVFSCLSELATFTKPIYYYIGSFGGGLTWNTWFADGKTVYINCTEYTKRGD